MYINKCTKCGKEFETKNPKRVICPACLYPDRAAGTPAENEAETPKEETAQQPPAQSTYTRSYSTGNTGSYSAGGTNMPYKRPQQRENYPPRQNNNGRPGGGFRKPFNNRPKVPRAMLLDKEQLLQLETMYKKMLPLPNPDAHEVIGQALNIEPKKAFFGINLIRQKMMLPKVPFPKRKLALTTDQLTAIKNLYEPLLPLPPIGCHKIIAAQLKMDEWRVHVGIGLVRKQIGLERWNPEREDAPAEYKVKKEENKED
jgi:hypothetical protein